MKIWTLLIAFLMIVNSSFTVANASDVLRKGNPAPYDGILFNEQEANDVKKTMLKVDTLEEMVKLYERNQDIYKKNEELYKQKVDNLEKYVQQKDYEKYIWIGIGVLFTGFSVYVAKETLVK